MAKQDDHPSCEQIINMLPQPFVVIDRNYRIQAANQAYRKRYGFEDREIIGRACHEVSHHSSVPCSEHGEHCPLETVFATSQPTQVMHVHYDKEGGEEFVQLQANPIYNANGEIMFMGETIHRVNSVDVDDQLKLSQ